jgi:DNA-binding transcriptional LysR family regulator
VIGQPLFVRDTRNLELGQTGRALLPYARRLLNLHDETWTALVQPEVQGRIMIGAPDDYIGSLLPNVLRKFSGIYPRSAKACMYLASVFRPEGLCGLGLPIYGPKWPKKHSPGFTLVCV